MAAPAPLPLRAGALSTTLHEGRLGPVFVDGHEAWHGVHFLLRDRHWRTPALRLGAPRTEVLEGGWRVVVEGRFDVEPTVTQRLEVEGRDDGTLCITGEARPAAAVDINRLGLCLLHPLDNAGQALQVTHDDGRETGSTFPTLVPAWPPFTAIRSLRHPVAPGCMAEARFEGDSFEFEDQRNNADASYKTYSRSNFMPRPYRLQAGDVVRQRVVLRVQGRPVAARRAPARTGPAAEVPLPDGLRIGVEVAAADLRALHDSASRVAAWRPDHLHLAMSAREPLPAVHALAPLLAAGGSALRLDLLDVDPEAAPAFMVHLAQTLRSGGVAAAEVAVFPTTPQAVAAARRAFPHARVGGGTPDFFVQLNRLEALPALDFLGFTVCPIVHAADDATLIDGHRSLQGMMDTLRHRRPGVPVHVGPSRIAARRSPLGELAPADATRPLPLAGHDARERTAFGAGWVAAHIAAAALAGIGTITVAAVSLGDSGSPLAALLAALGRRDRRQGLRALLAAAGHAPAGLRVVGGDGVCDWWLPPAAADDAAARREPAA